MTEEKKCIVRMLAVTFAVMLAIPLAYRVWITFSPPVPSGRLSLAEFADMATANRSVRLLKTPLCGVQMYRKLLDAHEAAVDRKLTAVRKQRAVAQSLYDTVSVTVDFGGMLQSAQDDYSAVMELELPDIAVIDDSVTEEQINAISKMLDMN